MGASSSNGSSSNGAGSSNSNSSNGGGNVGLFDPAVAAKYAQWSKVTRVGPGFFNDGNSCYLNSTLQCLVHTPALAQILQSEGSLVLRGMPERGEGREKGKSVLEHFRNLVCEVWGSSSRAISPRGMVATIRRVGKQFKPMRQEDAHEYLRQLLDCMHEEVLKARSVKISDGKIAETSMVSRIFGGYLCNTLACSKCAHVSRTYNHFQDLSLDITNAKSVAQAIDAFTRAETLSAGNEWKCDKCSLKTRAQKQMFVSQAPNVLVLHLKRFSFGNMQGKLTKPVQFGVEL
ncbi:hypothetical protein B484DRAFT_339022, partial [Ochromonadaceae sp. CCMP2298]